MLTFETLFAVLQGLPFFYLDYLDREWLGLCKNIYRALQAGCDPITALRYAIQESSPHQVKALRDTFQKAQPIMELPGLSFRQKETLVALRLAKVASLAALNRTLMQDPAHVHRRLAALVRKGYAVKFVRPDGVFYYAAEKPLEHSAKAAAYRMIMELMQTLLNDPALTTLASFVPQETPAVSAIPAMPATSAMSAIPAMTAMTATG
jgi:hypothetical protein